LAIKAIIKISAPAWRGISTAIFTVCAAQRLYAYSPLRVSGQSVHIKQLEKIRKCLKVTKAIVVQPAKFGYSPAGY